MFNERFIYQEEAGEEGSAGGAGDSLLDGAAPGDGGESGDGDGESGNSGDWFHAEGVQGEGDKPGFLQDKYKSVAAQAEAYPELAKKLGAHTGAPEEYDLTMPEGSSELIAIDPENEKVMAYLERAREGGISQEFMAESMAFHADAMATALGDLIPDKAAEVAALGKDAASRITNVADWGQANLDEDQFEQLRAVTMTADGVELVEALILKTRGASVAPSDTTANTSGMTEDKLKEMRYAKDDAGNLKIQSDPVYKNKVDTAYQEFYGKEPRKEVVNL